MMRFPKKGEGGSGTLNFPNKGGMEGGGVKGEVPPMEGDT